jgi:hypothetical protein
MPKREPNNDRDDGANSGDAKEVRWARWRRRWAQGIHRRQKEKGAKLAPGSELFAVVSIKVTLIERSEWFVLRGDRLARAVVDEILRTETASATHAPCDPEAALTDHETAK